MASTLAIAIAPSPLVPVLNNWPLAKLMMHELYYVGHRKLEKGPRQCTWRLGQR